MWKNVTNASTSLAILLLCIGGLTLSGGVLLLTQPEIENRLMGTAAMFIAAVWLVTTIKLVRAYFEGGPWKKENHPVEEDAPCKYHKGEIRTARGLALARKTDFPPPERMIPTGCKQPIQDSSATPPPTKDEEPILSGPNNPVIPISKDEAQRLLKGAVKEHPAQLTFDDKLKEQKAVPVPKTPAGNSKRTQYPPVVLDPVSRTKWIKANEVNWPDFIEAWNDDRLTVADVAFLHNTLPSTVTRWAKKLGLPLKQRKKYCRVAMDDLISCLQGEGGTRDPMLLSATLGISYTTLRTYINRINNSPDLLKKVYKEKQV